MFSYKNANAFARSVFDVLYGVFKNYKENGEPTANTNTISNADEIKKYKDLLDAGAITQEEFEAKKKQLLGL
jgi:hypothetical protein